MEGNKSIFVSYRRDETAAYAGWLADMLGDHFGAQNVFRDIGSIEPGMDFVEALEHAVERCAVMLVVMGRNWATALKEYEQRGQEDYTRLEVSTALKRNIRVIPVLVQGALMPRAEELHDDMAAIRRRQAVELHDTNWESDVAYLIAQLEKIVGRGEEGTRSGVSLEQRAPGDVAQGTIRIRRDDEAFAWRRKTPITVFVDGEEIGNLFNGQYRDLKLEPGLHQLAAQNADTQGVLASLQKLNEKFQEQHITVHVNSGEVHEVLCGFRGWKSSNYTNDLFIKLP